MSGVGDTLLILLDQDLNLTFDLGALIGILGIVVFDIH